MLTVKSTGKLDAVAATRVAVIGAGVGGLAAAIDLAASGFAVTVLESAPTIGGKMRTVSVDGATIDAGPTVFTMRHVFDALFARAGTSLDAHVTLDPATILARHAWSETERLDLFADMPRSADAIGAFAGAAAASGYLRFCERARKVFRTLEHSFMTVPRPGVVSLATAAGLRGLSDFAGASPFSTLWKALADDFPDPRLRQLFARYSTYSGASPFLAPAILMLIAHVEQQGVWLVRGGMHALARAMGDVLIQCGGEIRCGSRCDEILSNGRRATGVRLSSGEVIETDAVVVNGDVSALAQGLFGEASASGLTGFAPSARSLSAMTWTALARCDGFALVRHNVFFARDYAAEFDAVFRRGCVGGDPTVYVCAQDRDDTGEFSGSGGERLLILVNAPANGDTARWDAEEQARCRSAAWGVMARCGLQMTSTTEHATTPADFARLFPATGGALYGVALHGPMTAFKRMGSRAKLPGLYLTGGSVHPGPGVPMAAISGGLAASALQADFASTQRFRMAATRGGMSTR